MLKNCVREGLIIMASIAFQMKNLIMDALVTLRSFQVIFEWEI